MDATELSAVGVGCAGEEDGVVQTQVLRLARLAHAAGIDGLVCSAEEVAAVRKAMEPEALLVVPGIRPAGTVSSDDQSRVATAATGDCAWGFQAGGGPADYAGGGPGRGCSRDSGRDPKRGGLATRVGWRSWHVKAGVPVRAIEAPSGTLIS